MEKMISIYSDEESEKAFIQKMQAIASDEKCEVIMSRHGISITANYRKLNEENKRRQDTANRRIARKFWVGKAKRRTGRYF